MIRRIAHIAIAVRNLQASKDLFGRLLGRPADHEEVVEHQQVRTAMFRVGGVSLELLEGTSADSSVRKFVDAKGEGLHHISFVVDDVGAELEHLRDMGFDPIDRPRTGADNTLVAFLHPRSANGVLIELSQDIKGKKDGGG